MTAHVHVDTHTVLTDDTAYLHYRLLYMHIHII